MSLVRAGGLTRENLVTRPAVREFGRAPFEFYDNHWASVGLLALLAGDASDASGQHAAGVLSGGATVGPDGFVGDGQTGASANLCAFTDHADYEPVGGAYTMEYTMELLAVPNPAVAVAWDVLTKYNADTNNREWFFWYNTDGAGATRISWAVSTNGTAFTEIHHHVLATAFILGKVYDLMLSREADGTAHVYVNGTRLETFAAADVVVRAGTAAFHLGHRDDDTPATSASPNAKIRNLRMTKGVARETGAFYARTPMVATGPVT